MTVEQIKEALSNNYVASIANKLGFELVKDNVDEGVDFSVKYGIRHKMPNGKTSIIKSPLSFDLQLKSTTNKWATNKGGKIIYDLKAKNYNQLIYRYKLGLTPLFLILFVLPDNEVLWVKVLKDALRLSKHAYWYYPSDKDTEVKNTGTKRIEIPISNKLDFDFFETTIKKWIPKWNSTP